MGKGSLRRSINYAMNRCPPEPFPRCATCGEGDGRITVKDRKRNRVWLVCGDCAGRFIDEANGEPCAQHVADVAAERAGV